MTPELTTALAPQYGSPLTVEQQHAVQLVAASSRVVVLTGGPGTGKTFTLSAILDWARVMELRVKLAAPTGKAAKRMAEVTGRSASTIHRLLMQADGPLPADLVVVDEASMLDVELFQALLQALSGTCQLLLVGDEDQLPSVGPGAVLRDVIVSGVVPVARLTQVMRQSERSWIHTNAQRINRGEQPVIDNARSDDFLVIEEEDAEQIPGRIARLLTTTLHQRFPVNPRTGVPYHPVQDIQVLTPMHRGPAGTTNLNKVLREALNPLPPGVAGDPALLAHHQLTYGDDVFRVGDRVMQHRNNYDLKVFNGEGGTIVGLEQGALLIDFGSEEGPLRYPLQYLHELKPAFAVSGHKSQGSEYPVVVVVCHTTHYIMLSRQLLYTMQTRGKQLVFVIGNLKGLKRSVDNGTPAARYSRLAGWLRDGVTERVERAEKPDPPPIYTEEDIPL